MSNETLENLLAEDRAFPPPPQVAAAANVQADAYQAADADRLAFWAAAAKRLTWVEPWSTVLDWSDAPFARWFIDGTLNVAYNCVDRHVEAGRGDRTALIFEAEDGTSQAISYADLQVRVCQAAHALESLGVRVGDRVAIYLPMIPEAVVSMLACA